MHEHLRNISGSVPEDLDTKGVDLVKLFGSPPPEGWHPKVGDKVYICPGITFGGSRVQRAIIIMVGHAAATIETQIGRRRKTRAILIQDLRPVL